MNFHSRILRVLLILALLINGATGVAMAGAAAPSPAHVAAVPANSHDACAMTAAAAPADAADTAPATPTPADHCPGTHCNCICFHHPGTVAAANAAAGTAALTALHAGYIRTHFPSLVNAPLFRPPIV